MKKTLALLTLAAALTGCTLPSSSGSSSSGRRITPPSRAQYTFDKGGRITSKTVFHYSNGGRISSAYREDYR